MPASRTSSRPGISSATTSRTCSRTGRRRRAHCGAHRHRDRGPSVRASGRGAGLDRDGGRARQEAQDAEGAAAQGVADQHARPERDHGPGLARDTAYKLTAAGFQTQSLPPTILADAPSQNYYKTTVYYDTVQAHALQAAEELKLRSARTRRCEAPPELLGFAQQANNPLTVVVVGSSFNGQLVNPQAHIAPTPTYVPPAVRDDPGATLASIQQLEPKIPFRPLVPSVIEQTSQLSSLEGARAFKPVPYRHEPRSDLRDGRRQRLLAGDRDRLDERADPQSPDRQRDGSRAARTSSTRPAEHPHGRPDEGGATYWVVNTLLDSLSNETMIAIAKGLQPLGARRLG